MILILRMVLEKLYKEGMSVSFSTQKFCSFWFSCCYFLCYCFQRAQNCLTMPAPSTFDPIMYVRRRLLYATCTSPIMHLICPPKICITFVFYFSWVLQPSQEKLKTACEQAFGSSGHKKERGARGRHAREEGASAREAHENRFNSLPESAEISYWLRVC